MPLPFPFLINFIYLAGHSAERNRRNFTDCLYVRRDSVYIFLYLYTSCFKCLFFCRQIASLIVSFAFIPSSGERRLSLSIFLMHGGCLRFLCLPFFIFFSFSFFPYFYHAHCLTLVPRVGSLAKRTSFLFGLLRHMNIL